MIIFIIIPCSLVSLMPDFLFFLTIHVPEIFLVFVWDCGLSVKRSTSLGFTGIYLFLLGNINFCKKKGIHIYMLGCRWENYYIFFFLLGILNFFLYNLSLTFLPILQNPSYLEMFWKFPYPSQVGYQNICTIKGMTPKVTAEDGSVPFVVSDIPGIKSFFLTF